MRTSLDLEKNTLTIDSIFALHFVIELLRLKRKKLYCAFIDFAKAFDTVWRPGLWSKLLKHAVNGNMYKTIINMYSNVNSRVFNGEEYLDFFLVMLVYDREKCVSFFHFI
jgi:hypothetical protein